MACPARSCLRRHLRRGARLAPAAARHLGSQRAQRRSPATESWAQGRSERKRAVVQARKGPLSTYTGLAPSWTPATGLHTEPSLPRGEHERDQSLSRNPSVERSSKGASPI
eukprot:scaffold7551_cov123-Isochrysis_galbana.AAC.11